jgi:hypothetical protein
MSDHELKHYLPKRLYYRLSDAASELDCTETDIIHWGAIGKIELVAVGHDFKVLAIDWRGGKELKYHDVPTADGGSIILILNKVHCANMEKFGKTQYSHFSSFYEVTRCGLLSVTTTDVEDTLRFLNSDVAIHKIASLCCGSAQEQSITLSLKDVFILKTEIRRIQGNQKQVFEQQVGAVSLLMQRPTIIERRKIAIVEYLKKIYNNLNTIPKIDKSSIRANFLDCVEYKEFMFTKSTFDKAWQQLSAENKIGITEKSKYQRKSNK